MLKAVLIPAVLAAAPAAANVTSYTENNLLLVIAHEVGHAFIREFDVPVLGNEETMADAFALALLWREMPDRLPGIVTDRVRQMRFEQDEESPFAEHPGDVWRAGQIVCLFYALDPQAHFDTAVTLGIGEYDGACADRGAEVARAWRRALAEQAMPDNARVTEVRIRADAALQDTLGGNEDLGQALFDLLAGIDWHSLITVSFADCGGDERATWARNGRTITICDGLIQRFENEAPN
ncbi:MAG: DUF4344 domain-containing metallopeptidase [Pseudomonadota bacterium]